MVKVLIKDYTRDRDTHVFKWNYARAYTAWRIGPSSASGRATRH